MQTQTQTSKPEAKTKPNGKAKAVLKAPKTVITDAHKLKVLDALAKATIAEKPHGPIFAKFNVSPKTVAGWRKKKPPGCVARPGGGRSR